MKYSPVLQQGDKQPYLVILKKNVSFQVVTALCTVGNDSDHCVCHSGLVCHTCKCYQMQTTMHHFAEERAMSFHISITVHAVMVLVIITECMTYLLHGSLLIELFKT